jgi:leader peptidase (prepilin peptidase)/N-methyltransferase
MNKMRFFMTNVIFFIFFFIFDSISAYASHILVMTAMMLIKIVFFFFSLIISAADIKKGEVPRMIFIIAFVFLLTFIAVMQGRIQLIESIIGFSTGLFIFLLVYFFSGKRLGLADVWYSAIIGLILGPFWWYGAICLACISGVLFCLITKQRQIPFIPFMALGSMVMNFIQR